MLNRLNEITLLDNFLFPSSNQLPGTVLKLLHCHGPLKSVLQDELVSLIKLLVLILPTSFEGLTNPTFIYDAAVYTKGGSSIAYGEQAVGPGLTKRPFPINVSNDDDVDEQHL